MYLLLQRLILAPTGSEASIIFGKGITSAKRGSAGSLVLAVDEIEAARNELIACGVKVSRLSSRTLRIRMTPLTEALASYAAST